jgi:hypothetical protein
LIEGVCATSVSQNDCYAIGQNPDRSSPGSRVAWRIESRAFAAAARIALIVYRLRRERRDATLPLA